MLNKIYRFFNPGENHEIIRRDFNIPENINFQLEMFSDGYIVISSDELPGFIAEARNSSEILDALNNALTVYFDVPRKCGDIIFPALDIAGHGTISYSDKNSFKLASN